MSVLKSFKNNLKNFGIGLGLLSMAACGEADVVKPDTGNGTTNPGAGSTTPKTTVITLENNQVDLGVYTLFPEGSTGSEGRTQVPHSLSFKDQDGNGASVLASPSNRTEMVIDFSANQWQENAGGDYSYKTTNTGTIANTGTIKLYAKKGGKFTLGNAQVDTVYIKTPFINSSAVPSKNFPTTPLIQLFQNHEDMLSGKNGIKYVGGNDAPYTPLPFKNYL